MLVNNKATPAAHLNNSVAAGRGWGDSDTQGAYFRSMPVKKRPILAKRKPATRRSTAPKPARVALKRSVAVKPKRKLLSDKSLFGALPGMADWALPLLKELRNE